MIPMKNDKIMKLRKMFSLLSNISLAAGSVIAVYSLIKIYLSYQSLPAGICPLDMNRPWMYTAIVLLGMSFLLSFFEPHKQKEENK